MSGKITLGRYMWERLHQVGVDTIFGVPGDFNLQFLDSIYEVKDLKWIGNQNELNAAYAADGYARIKGVPGVIVTTHGVGELSALNGVAGAMSENVKLIHIVGQTTRAMQEKHMMIHHSIGSKPDHQMYNKAATGLRFAAAELWDVKTAPKEIDRVIKECFLQSGPVNVYLPLDLSAEEVDADLLKTPIDISPKVDTAAEQKAVKAITDALSSAKHPAVLIDALAHRFNATSETRELFKKLNVPFFSTNMSKGLVDETEEMYIGLWNGEVGTPGVKEAGMASDLVLVLGYLPADTNSGGFSRKLDDSKTIYVNPFEVIVKGTSYPNTHLKSVLATLNNSLPQTPTHKASKPQLPAPRVPNDLDAKHITQSWLWPRLMSYIRPGDVLISETGTTSFGLCDNIFPSNVRFQGQNYYGSIGWATPATLGAEVARLEVDQARKEEEKEEQGTGQGRTVLVTGDGSLAMTIQEIGTMIKAGLKIVIFIVNNDGYTVERMIWGAKQAYNDIVPTNYAHLLPLFHHPDPERSFHKAATKEELEKILEKEEVKNPENLQIVELVVPKLDTAWRLGGQLAVRGEAARKYLKEEGFVDALGNWGLDEGGGVGGVKWA
ncbi:thiamine diphosphate-binding protein [Lophiotrema nucula]|uniref:Pyruvate decarboxylase n=1 Tax=Lophiotrema nucula TaxID=690887 RepID=A0A6A5Z5X6_9PLEO|nr:thiamine diphosphate-binding protein [Lophiotrema nucula]